MLQRYRETLPFIKLSGPTYFAPILESFKAHCERQYSIGRTNYNVSLIITDGSIHDMQKSIKLLVDLSVYACSVIIIGVGEEGEFDNMYELC